MSDCILWDGAANYKGYGLTGTGELAHRAAYRMNFGEIPDGYHVHHKCGTPDCVNPDHLETLSPLEHNREHVSGPAGSKPGDIVLDPFVGSGTTALVARKHGRHCIGIDLSSDYLGIAARRLQQLSLLAEETA